MIIGGCRSDFWKLTPRTIQLDFDAYEERQKREAQDRWEIGAYVRMALNSSILVATLADKTTASQMPSYPQKPFKEENSQEFEGMTEEQLKNERLRAYCFFKTLGRNRK